MLWIKCCPRCIDGDLVDKGDIYGPYMACFHCGYHLEKMERAAFSYYSVAGHGMRRRSLATGPVTV